MSHCPGHFPGHRRPRNESVYRRPSDRRGPVGRLNNQKSPEVQARLCRVRPGQGLPGAPITDVQSAASPLWGVRFLLRTSPAAPIWRALASRRSGHCAPVIVSEASFFAIFPPDARQLSAGICAPKDIGSPVTDKIVLSSLSLMFHTRSAAPINLFEALTAQFAAH